MMMTRRSERMARPLQMTAGMQVQSAIASRPAYGRVRAQLSCLILHARTLQHLSQPAARRPFAPTAAPLSLLPRSRPQASAAMRIRWAPRNLRARSRIEKDIHQPDSHVITCQERHTDVVLLTTSFNIFLTPTPVGRTTAMCTHKKRVTRDTRTPPPHYSLHRDESARRGEVCGHTHASARNQDACLTLMYGKTQHQGIPEGTSHLERGR